MKKIDVREVIIVLSLAVVILLALFSITFPFIEKTNEDTIEIVVTEKSIKPDQSNSYLIFTENEVFEIEDDVAYWRWDSSDTYNKIKVGETYNCKVCGWRIPMLSTYRNIITADIVPASETSN